MSEAEWILRTHDVSHGSQNRDLSQIEPKTAASGHQWPSLVEKILAARGLLSHVERSEFLYPKLTQLKDPLSLLGMQQAVERMSEALLRQEKICIYADFDLDGTSGLALLLNGLKSLGFENVIGYQPRRLKSGYGFHAEVVTELVAQGVTLIVTVDVGITAIEAAAKAKELGIDVIITDHHQPGEILPNALVVINPNQKNCTSGLGYLSGAGVAFYLLRALRRGLEPLLNSEAQAWDLKSVLDFFTIATITDMVPLVADNRVLIKHGLHQLAKTEHVGLRALLTELDLLGRPLNSQDVGIRFAPKLNALSRMDSEILPIDIMMAADESQAQSLIEKTMKSNQNRIELQLEADSEAQRLLLQQPVQNFIFLASEKFHRGVIGLIAQKLSQAHQVPVFIGSIDAENQKVVGSARAPDNSMSLVSILGQLSGLMERFGGHHAAAGFEFKLSNLQNVGAEFKTVFSNLSNVKVITQLAFDAEAELHELNSQFMKWYEFLGPFGTGFEVPLLALKNVQIESLRVLKGQHLKLKLQQFTEIDGEEKVFFLEALMFSAQASYLQTLKPGMSLDFLVEPQWNYFGGKKSIQALVRDLKVIPQI